MKNIKIQIIALVLIVATVVSCNNSSNKDNSTVDTISVISEKTEVRKDGIAPILSGYLALNNALAADNSKGAAEAGESLLSGLENVDMNSIAANKMKQFMELSADVKENAEHIRDNAGKIDHQREHLEFLSKDVLDLITLLGAPQKLYQIHCPMASNEKGADWISDSKEVKNPYFGKDMLTCGEVVKEFKP
ncbi:MAG: DUF3347 domain-containing protein [Chlorobi bacterium]|nr:DUF3347 domain-containing protein [Chlorobiota bacterium]MBZ0193740.1 DUF3347 domain-containing protein [Candidatus Kapabacteria bacterium]MCC7526755.1 DUF3347 domain-containing protein [Chitinophagaceae bacterium]MCW5932316.1 DUF3347 domain-containing protein [Bacteroidota bacterium]QOJ25550.1 MAG: DUF3347 domain-containing protein [Ignavibacteria bacterium]